MIQFHLDENVPRSVATGLRKRGIDVTTSFDAGLIGATDIEHLLFAQQGGRVIFTHDGDFLALHRQGHEHAGIVYAPPGARPIGYLIRSLLLITQILAPDDMRNHIEFI